MHLNKNRLGRLESSGAEENILVVQVTQCFKSLAVFCAILPHNITAVDINVVTTRTFGFGQNWHPQLTTDKYSTKSCELPVNQFKSLCNGLCGVGFGAFVIVWDFSYFFFSVYVPQHECVNQQKYLGRNKWIKRQERSYTHLPFRQTG